MTNKRIPHEYSQNSREFAELELLEALLQAEVPYPWNPADPDSEAYLTTLEQTLTLEEWADDEVARRSQSFYAAIEPLWATARAGAPSIAEKVASVRESLYERFAAYMPIDALEAIASSVPRLLEANLSFADRLVQCASLLLPDWAEEDLHVLARPLAYAMRSTEPSLTNLPQGTWTELSEIERARLTLAIAHYALTNSQTDDI